jgi:hypothetical protein
VGKPGLYVAVYIKGGKQKVSVLKDTLLSEKEARERAARLWEAIRVSTASVPVPLPLAPKLQAP